jgi:hypothetical protein
MSDINPILEARGLNGQMQLFQNNVRIEHKGKQNNLNKDIVVSNISAIKFRETGFLVNGYLQILTFGGGETKIDGLTAKRDENTIIFNKKQQPLFEDIRDAINKRRRLAVDSLREMEKLADSRRRRIIISNEFNDNKQPSTKL